MWTIVPQGLKICASIISSIIGARRRKNATEIFSGDLVVTEVRFVQNVLHDSGWHLAPGINLVAEPLGGSKKHTFNVLDAFFGHAFKAFAHVIGSWTKKFRDQILDTEVRADRCCDLDGIHPDTINNKRSAVHRQSSSLRCRVGNEKHHRVSPPVENYSVQ